MYKVNIYKLKFTLKSIADEMHCLAKTIFPRRKIITHYMDDLWQVDLINIQLHSRKNNSYKFFLVIIYTFTKYVYVNALKSKFAKEVTRAIFKIKKKKKRINQNYCSQMIMEQSFIMDDFKI